MSGYNNINADSVVDFFNLDEMNRIIQEQIIGEDDFSVCTTMTDHLKPLYDRYKNINVDVKNGITSDDVDECHKKFNAICMMFITAINKKFNISLDDTFVENASDDEMALVSLYMYTYFVIDFKTILTDILINYMDANIETLSSMFENALKTQKDAVFMSYKSTLDPKYAVVCGNIFDVIYYILDSLTVEDYFKYSPMDYLPSAFLNKLFEECTLCGDFTDKIFAMVKANSALRSFLAFEITSHVKRSFKLNNTVE